METIPELSDEQRSAMLRSLTDVGVSKPVGYLPLETIRKCIRATPRSVADAAKARGLATARFYAKDCRIYSGALYVYDRQALSELLRADAEAVSAAELPLDPEDFVKLIATVTFEQDHLAYPIIAAAFGDKD